MSLNNGFRHSRNIAIVPALLLILHFMYECKILYIYDACLWEYEQDSLLEKADEFFLRNQSGHGHMVINTYSIEQSRVSP